MAAAAQQGDEDALFLLHGLVRQRLRGLCLRYHLPFGGDHDDLMAIAAAAVIREALPQWDRRGSFWQWAWFVANRRLANVLNAALNRPGDCAAVSLDAPSDQRNQDAKTWIEVIPAQGSKPRSSAPDLIEEIIEMLSLCLTEHEAQIIDCLYYHGESHARIAAGMNISLKSVDNGHQSALRKMRTMAQEIADAPHGRPDMARKYLKRLPPVSSHVLGSLRVLCRVQSHRPGTTASAC